MLKSTAAKYCSALLKTTFTQLVQTARELEEDPSRDEATMIHVHLHL